MIITANRFQSSAIEYINLLGDTTVYNQDRIAKALVNSLSANKLEKLAEEDFKLLVNQFFNLVCFGPITNLELFITEDCNLACDYCFVREKSHKVMPLETIFSAINFLSFFSGNQTNLNLTLFGGEPLMAKETIYSIVEYVKNIEAESKNKQFSISITTNGTLLSEEFLKRTHEKINYLLSIDGDKATHDSYRKYKNGKGTFDAVVSKIKLLKKYQPWLGARMTVMPDTAQKLHENIVSLHKLGINQIILGPAMDMEWHQHDLDTYEEQMKKVGLFYLEKKSERAPFRMTLFEKDEKGIECSEHQWGCGAGRNTISINTKGDIYPCSKFIGYEEFEAPELILGNIFEGINNIKLRNRLTKMTDSSYPECTSCKEVNACMGGCPADNYYLNRDIFSPGKAHCEIKKIENRVIKEILDINR